jgi:hypothetical protein
MVTDLQMIIHFNATSPQTTGLILILQKYYNFGALKEFVTLLE